MPTHAEHQLVAYTPEQLFELVADVGHYPEFLPWCVGARVRTRTETEVVADLTIGFGPFRESFTSRVALERPSLITVRYERGPFRYLNNTWRFKPDPRGCRVEFFVDFEFRSRLLQSAIGVVFNEAVRRMVNAFLKRARDIYGHPRPAGTAQASAPGNAPAHPSATGPMPTGPATTAPAPTGPAKTVPAPAGAAPVHAVPDGADGTAPGPSGAAKPQSVT